MSLPVAKTRNDENPILVLCIAFHLPSAGDIQEPLPPEGMKDYPENPNYNSIAHSIRMDVVENVKALIENPEIQIFCEAAFIQASNPEQFDKNLDTIRHLPGVKAAEVIDVRNKSHLYLG